MQNFAHYFPLVAISCKDSLHYLYSARVHDAVVEIADGTESGFFFDGGVLCFG